MPILASTTYVNAYGKSAVIAVQTGASNLTSLSMSTDIFIVKYDTLGKSIWSTRISSKNENDFGYGIDIDTSGNVYVSGQISGQGNDAGQYFVYNSDGSLFGIFQNRTITSDGFVVKYNTNGFAQWVSRIVSSTADVAYGISTDSSGNVYVTGSYNGGLTVFNANGTAFGTTLSNSGSGDAFIIKYNTDGAVQWVARIASTGLEYGYDAETDASGNLYVIGAGGAATITAFSSNGNAFATTLASLGLGDVFLVKYDTNGNVQWFARLGTTAADIGYGIATDSSGNVYITGQTGAATFTSFSANGAAFSPTLANSGGNDCFIVKYDTNGNVLWNARVASAGGDIGYSIATDSSGSAYVCSQYTGNATAFNANGTSFATTAPLIGSVDTCIVKYDTNGTVQWFARLGSSTAAEIPYAISTDSSGNVYVTGLGQGIVTVFNASGTQFGTTIPNTNNNDAIIIKYNTNGVVQWVTRIAGSGDDRPYGIVSDSVGNFYVTGRFAGQPLSIYGQSMGLFSSIPNAGAQDAFIVKYNTNGAPQWVGRIASTGIDFGYSTTTDSSGNVYATGYGSGTVTAFNANGTAFATTIPNSGGSDAYVVKYDTSGNVQWLARLAGTSNDVGLAIVADSTGSVYITGQPGGVVTAFNANGTSFATTTNSAFLVKYDTNGVVQWVARLASAGSDQGWAIAADSSDNVYLTGQIGSGTMTAFNSNGTSFATTLPNSGAQDAFVAKYNSSGFVQWVGRIASTGIDIGYGIATDASGDVYVTGAGGAATVSAFSANGVAFGTTLANAGLGDLFLVKFNTNGTVQWVARIASAQSDVGYAVATDPSGNVYVTGQGGNATFTCFNSDGTSFGDTNPTLEGSGDCVIAKYNTNGFVQWRAYLGSNTSDIAYGIDTDNTGAVYIVGNFGSATNQLNVYERDNRKAAEIIGSSAVIKYDTNGFFVWSQTLRGTNAAATGRGISVDTTGGVYVTGVSVSGQPLLVYNSDSTIYRVANISSGSGFKDAYIVKYNSNTTPQWVARISSVTGEDTAYGIATDPSGNVYVSGSGGAGAIIRAFNANNTQFATTLANSGARDIYVVKYDTNGSVQWLARIASQFTDNDNAGGIATDSSGNVYVIGWGGPNQTQAFNANGTVFSPNLANSGGTDCFIVKYNTNGTVQWMARIAGANADQGYGIATDSSGNVYVTGAYISTTLTAFSAGGTAFGTTLSNSGSNDCFVVKFNTNGIVQWVARISSTSGETGYGIATDSSGSVYVALTGGTTSVAVTAFNSNGTTGGSQANSGSGDAFLVKYNTNGTFQFIARVGSASNDISFAVAVDSSGNAYVTGNAGSGNTVTAFDRFGIAFGTTFTASGADAFVVKYNTSGDVQWLTRIGSQTAGTSELGYGIATDSSGSVYITGIGGTFSSPIIVYNANGTVSLSSVVPISGSVSFVVKYDTNGNGQWLSVTGQSPFGVNGSAISLDSAGNIYVAGDFANSALISYST